MGRILSWTACLGVCLLQVPCAQAARIVVMATNSGSSTTSNSQPPSAVAGAKGFLIGIDNMTDPLGPLAFLNLSFSGPGLVQRLAPNAAAAEAFVTAPNVQQRSTAASANAFDPVAGSQFAANDSFWWNQNLNVNGQFYTLEPVQAGIQGGLPGGPMTMTGTYNLTGNVPAGIWPVAYIVTTSNLQVAGILASGGNQFGPWGPVGSMVQLNLDGPSYGTAVDTTWINPAGGSFGAGANWSAGQTPLPGNRTVFNLAETYAVSVASNTTTAFMRVQAGDVTLDLNGSTYTVAPFANGALGPPSNGVEVSSASGPAPTLRITDGNMVTDYGTYIGSSVGFDAPGAATIEAGATWTENSFFIVRKDSQLTIENGGALIVNSQHLSNYEFQSATGSTVILHKGSIDVPRAAFNSAATLHIGLGTLTLANSASLRSRIKRPCEVRSTSTCSTDSCPHWATTSRSSISARAMAILPRTRI